MSLIEQNNLWMKKWAIICGILILIAVFLPIPTSTGLTFWTTRNFEIIDFLDIITLIIGIIFLILPLLLRFILNGKPLSASLLAYCCLAQIGLTTVFIIPIGDMSNLYSTINSLGINSPGIKLIAHLSLFSGKSIIPMILLIIVLGSGNYLANNLSVYRYPFVISGIAASLILAACMIAFTNLFLEYPKEFENLGNSQLWSKAWYILINILLLFMLSLCVIVQSLKRSTFFLVRILLISTIIIGPLLILFGSFSFLSELTLGNIFIKVLIYTKIMAGLYGMYILFAVSLISTLLQSTSLPQIQPHKPSKPKRRTPTYSDPDPLEDTVIM